MAKRRKSQQKKIIVYVLAIIFLLALLFGIAALLLRGETNTGTTQGIFDNNKQQQTKALIPLDQLDKTDNAAKYMTISRDEDIDVAVNYLNPVTGDKDTLIFDISVGTHSIDLAKYADIRKNVELRTDAGVTISDGFEWNLENNESHHIRGILKIKNDIEGKPIIDSDTKSFRLIFKNIGDAGTREHIYEGDKLK